MSTLSTTNLKNPSSASNNIVLDSSGRVLVGTSSARAFNTHNGSLQIDGDNYSESTVALIANSNDADGAYLTFAKQRSGSAGGNTVVQNNDIIGELRFNAGDGTDCDSLAGLITCRVDGTPGNNDMPGRLVFSTTADGSASPTERFRISSTGAQSSVIPGGSTLYPSFDCRAWVNFNGTGTVAIRASGNVSSITDNGTGDYTVNFTTALPDVNYAVAGTAGVGSTTNFNSVIVGNGTASMATGSCRVTAKNISGITLNDVEQIQIAIFR